jgi:hypothetical protein
VVIWAKLVQLEPRQRSILTSVWPVVPFVHPRPIELFVSAVAVRFVGAVREGAVTTMLAMLEYGEYPPAL